LIYPAKIFRTNRKRRKDNHSSPNKTK